jgi:hypothetical protein
MSPKEGKTTQWPKGQTMIYKTLHKKLKIEQHKPHLKLGVNSGHYIYFGYTLYSNYLLKKRKEYQLIDCLID